VLLPGGPSQEEHHFFQIKDGMRGAVGGQRGPCPWVAAMVVGEGIFARGRRVGRLGHCCGEPGATSAEGPGQKAQIPSMARQMRGQIRDKSLPRRLLRERLNALTCSGGIRDPAFSEA